MTTTSDRKGPAHHPTYPSNGPQNATQGAVNGSQGATPQAGVAA